METQKVRIFDTTLRDGEQTPGVSIKPEQKLKIAIKLSELGVDTIEAGFPVVSDGEKEGVKNIVKENLNTEICVLARTIKSDIDSAIDCGVNYVHTFIATSDIHMQYKLKMSRQQVLEKALWAVEYAKTHGLKVEFSAEDATRSDRKFLIDVFKAVTKAGADRIDIPDTVGYSTPEYIRSLVQEIRSKMDNPISVHCHNDFGLAVANSISAINAGASCAHVTINGLGERAGNASLEEFVMGLQCLYSIKHNIKVNLLYEISKFVSNTMGVIVQPNKAIIEENDFGIQLTDDQLHKIIEKQKDIADKGKSITTSQLLSIAGEIMGSSKFEEKFKLYDFHIITGMNIIPTAVIRLNTHGKDLVAAVTGVGPVDAALKAIQKIAVDMANIRIREFRLESITGGSDAMAEVTIKTEDLDGNVLSSRKSGEDVVVASVEAMIDAINKQMLRKVLYSKN